MPFRLHYKWIDWCTALANGNLRDIVGHNSVKKGRGRRIKLQLKKQNKNRKKKNHSFAFVLNFSSCNLIYHLIVSVILVDIKLKEILASPRLVDLGHGPSLRWWCTQTDTIRPFHLAPDNGPGIGSHRSLSLRNDTCSRAFAISVYSCRAGRGWWSRRYWIDPERGGKGKIIQLTIIYLLKHLIYWPSEHPGTPSSSCSGTQSDTHRRTCTVHYRFGSRTASGPSRRRTLEKEETGLIKVSWFAEGQIKKHFFDPREESKFSVCPFI